jgi:TolA-binding protein
MKLGLAYENNEQKDKALEAYVKIKKEYPRSTEARKIDKYIERVKL